MCPPMLSPLFEIGSSDEQIISLLDKYICGSPLPNNVIDDVDPYQCNPSDLPDGIWYFVHSNSNEKKETAFGFWKANGESQEIYLNSEFSGWRTALEFFEGQAPNGRRTGWLIHEYTITQKGLCLKTKPKDSKSLCFRSSVHSPKNEIQPRYDKTSVSAKCFGSVASVNPNNDNISAQDSSSKYEVKKVENSFPDDFPELECFLGGDFLELDDLAEPQSLSSSSENSSCPSRASDEYFDSLALLQDLNDDKQLQGKDLSKYSFSASVRPDKVVMKPATLGSIESGTGSKHAVEGFLTGSAPDTRFPDKQFEEHANQRQNPKHRIKGTANFCDEAKPSASRKGRKSHVGRIKRLREIFCCF